MRQRGICLKGGGGGGISPDYCILPKESPACKKKKRGDAERKCTLDRPRKREGSRGSGCTASLPRSVLVDGAAAEASGSRSARDASLRSVVDSAGSACAGAVAVDRVAEAAHDCLAMPSWSQKARSAYPVSHVPAPDTAAG